MYYNIAEQGLHTKIYIYDLFLCRNRNMMGLLGRADAIASTFTHPVEAWKVGPAGTLATAQLATL